MVLGFLRDRVGLSRITHQGRDSRALIHCFPFPVSPGVSALSLQGHRERTWGFREHLQAEKRGTGAEVGTAYPGYWYTEGGRVSGHYGQGISSPCYEVLIEGGGH